MLTTKLHIICGALLIIITFTSAKGQSSIHVASGDINENNGTINYTIGQMSYHTMSDGTYEMSEGVQHPIEIELIEVYDEQLVIDISVFPNPVSNNLMIHVENLIPYNLSMELFDINNRIILKQNIIQHKTIISFNKYSNGVYFLKLSDKSDLLKIYKIIKK